MPQQKGRFSIVSSMRVEIEEHYYILYIVSFLLVIPYLLLFRIMDKHSEEFELAQTGSQVQDRVSLMIINSK